jgi:glycosyltransferase involved in cell wall biosynthesis
MRTLFLDHTAALGGAELYLLDLARHRPDTCEVLLFEEGPLVGRLRAAGVPVSVLPAPRAVMDVRREAGVRSALRAVPGLIRLVAGIARRARHADVVVANSQKSMLAGGLACMLARRPFVWILHDLLTAEHFPALTRRLAVTAANAFARRVIVNSKAVRDAFRRAGGTVAAVDVVYNGISPVDFDAVSPETVATLRASLALGDGPVLGVFSRLAPWKGQHVLLEALPTLPPSTQVLFVGDALFDGDRTYAQALRARVRRDHLEDRVHFLGFRADVPALMRLCDVVLHTSVAAEPFGRVIVEGMLAGRPVVASQAGGAAEIIQDGRTGRLVPPNRPDLLSRAIGELLSDPQARHRLATAGTTHARHVFSLDTMVRGVTRSLRATRP